MVTSVPVFPEVGERLVIFTIVKFTPLLGVNTVTTTLPVVAPLGTLTLMLVSVQFPLVTVAIVPLNLTVLLP